MDDYVRVLAEKHVDGVIMVGSVMTGEEVGASIERYLPPLVMHNTTLQGDNIYNISTEEAYGIVLSVDYLAGEHGILYDTRLVVRTATVGGLRSSGTGRRCRDRIQQHRICGSFGPALARAMADVLRGRDIASHTMLYPELIRRGTA